MKKASVITVCYNSELTIRDTMVSVAKQRYKALEHIIIDGKSTDRTLDIIRQNNNKRVVVRSESDLGMYDAINKGIRLACGDVIFILNSDDIFNDSNVVSKIMEEFNFNETIDMVLTDVTFNNFNKLEKPVLRYISIKRYYLAFLRFGWMPPHPGMVISTACYRRIGFYKLGYKIAADYEFVVRAYFNNTLRVKKQSIVSVNMRPGGISTRNFWNNYTITKEILRAFRENNRYTNLGLLMPRFFFKPFIQIFLVRLRKK